MKRKEKKMVRKIGRIIPDIVGDISEGLGQHQPFTHIVEDIATDVFDDLASQTKTRSDRRMFSISDLHTVSKLMRIESADLVSDKFSTTADFLVFDQPAEVWRLRCTVPQDGIVKERNIVIGKSVTLFHIPGANRYQITTEMARIIYDHDVKAIMKYDLITPPNISAPVLNKT